MFVTTGCTTDERLNMAGGQDPRYSKALDPNYNSVSANRIPRYDYKYHYQGENPDSHTTCLSGCLCGYNRLQTNLSSFAPANAPYQAWNYRVVLSNFGPIRAMRGFWMMAQVYSSRRRMRRSYGSTP